MSEVTIKVEKLKMLFDLVAGSMDFGSGFLDSDDVTLMREIAVIIGVNPMEGTPSEFHRNFTHDYLEKEYRAAYPNEPIKRCQWCGKDASDSMHNQSEESDNGN